MAYRNIAVLLILTCIAACVQPGKCVQYEVGIYISGDTLLEDGSFLNLPRGHTVDIACRYLTSDAFALHPPSFHESDQELETVKGTYSIYSYLNYTISPSEATEVRVYVCEYVEVPNTRVQVTLAFDGSTPSPTTPPTTSEIHNLPTEWLNPLIYTVSAVILLGTLAIVAIITCWVRARRSYNSRMLRSNSTPQDYLDYISDNEFTPMTTSEFLASLQQRPPTYNESAEIESQMRRPQEGNNSEENPEGTSGGNSDNLPLLSSRIPRRRRRNRRGSGPERDEGNRTQEQSNTDSSNDTHEQTAPPATHADTHTASDSPTNRSNSASDGGGTGDREPQVATGTLVEVDMEPVAVSAPTEQQIIEIEAVVGAVNERMSRIRERDRELTQRIKEEDLPESESSTLLTDDRSLLEA